MEYEENHWKTVGHFYVPLKAFGGKVLRYEGAVSYGNKANLSKHYPDGVTLDSYKGDRINASDHSDFNQKGFTE